MHIFSAVPVPLDRITSNLAGRQFVVHLLGVFETNRLAKRSFWKRLTWCICGMFHEWWNLEEFGIRLFDVVWYLRKWELVITWHVWANHVVIAIQWNDSAWSCGRKNKCARQGEPRYWGSGGSVPSRHEVYSLENLSISNHESRNIKKQHKKYERPSEQGQTSYRIIYHEYSESSCVKDQGTWREMRKTGHATDTEVYYLNCLIRENLIRALQDLQFSSS